MIGHIREITYYVLTICLYFIVLIITHYFSGMLSFVISIFIISFFTKTIDKDYKIYFTLLLGSMLMSFIIWGGNNDYFILERDVQHWLINAYKK